MNDLIITERGAHDSSLGKVTQIKVFTPDYRLLSWSEVWEKFVETYPDKWAVQMFPPKGELVDSKNVYHLFVCDTDPHGLNIRG